MELPRRNTQNHYINERELTPEEQKIAKELGFRAVSESEIQQQEESLDMPIEIERSRKADEFLKQRMKESRALCVIDISPPPDPFMQPSVLKELEEKALQEDRARRAREREVIRGLVKRGMLPESYLK